MPKKNSKDKNEITKLDLTYFNLIAELRQMELRLESTINERLKDLYDYLKNKEGD